jgi:hypothetical protein
MLRGGADPGAVGLRQVHDKAIVGGLECKRISTRQLSGADRWTDFGDRADFPALVENLVSHRLGGADAMEDEIVVDDLAGQPSTAKSRREAERQGRDGARHSVRAAGERPCGGPGRAGGWSCVQARYGDLGDDGLAVEEQCLDDRTLTGGSTRQQIRTTKLLRRLDFVLRDRNPFRNGPADGSTCQGGTKVATVGASHITSSQHYCVSSPPVFRPAITAARVSMELAVLTVRRPQLRHTQPGCTFSEQSAMMRCRSLRGRGDRRHARPHGPQLSDRSISRQ